MGTQLLKNIFITRKGDVDKVLIVAVLSMVIFLLVCIAILYVYYPKIAELARAQGIL